MKSFLNTWVRDPLTPLVRAYFRYFPVDTGKRLAWAKLAPFFQWAPREFVASTGFGAKMSGHTVDHIDRCLYFLGVWEPNLTAFITRRLSGGDTFVDIGANTGYHTLLASRLVGETGSVVSIEASPSIYAILLANLERNRITNVRAVNVAASDQRGTLDLYRGPETNRGLSSSVNTSGRELEATVASLPTHEILEPAEAQHARLIKIDVEGAEAQVLAGLTPLLSGGRDDLEVVVEVTPQFLERADHTVGDILELFRAHGFHPYALADSDALEDNLPPRGITPPVRIRTPIQEQTDVVFSRIDADSL